MRQFLAWLWSGCWHDWEVTNKRDFCTIWYEMTCRKCGKIHLFEK